MSIFDYVSKVWRVIRSTKEGAVLVENAHAGFFDGRMFRSFFDFNLTEGTSAVVKFNSPVNFILHSQNLVLDAGEILFEASLGGSEGGSFNTSVPSFGMNRTSERLTPSYEAQVSQLAGGTHTGGTIAERVRLKTAAQQNSRQTVGGSLSDARALPPGTYYLRFTSTSGTSTGIYYLIWEERP